MIMLQHFSKSQTNRTRIMLGNRELEVIFSLLYQSRNEIEELFTLTVYYTIKIKTPMPTGNVIQDSKPLEN